MQPQIGFATVGSKTRLIDVAINAKQAFAARLVEAMLEAGFRSARNAKSGVDVGPLAKASKVTREMARRYTEGTAIPDANKMAVIADWLNVRVAWLRDGEGAMRNAAHTARQDSAAYGVGEDALEIARVWSRLSEDNRFLLRDMMFMLALAERRYPWLRRGRPGGETYDEWERRQQRAFEQIRIRADKAESS